MKKGRKQYSADYKSKVALAALKGDMSQSEICSQFEVQATQINRWKKQLIENAGDIFNDKRSKAAREAEETEEMLYKQIGKLQVQVDFLRKKLMP